MDATISELFNSLNDKMREVLAKTQSDGSTEIDFSKLSEALKYAGTPEEENALIEIFLRQSIDTDGKWGNVTMDKIEPYKDVLIKLCSELGLKEILNPFLNFLPEFYAKNPNADLTRDNMVDLNNLYATDVISKEDLMGKGKDKLDDIIFDSELYTFDDVEKMTSYIKWLGDIRNLKRMNWQEIRNADLTGAINEVADEVISSVGKNTLGDDDWEEFRNKLVYINGQGGKINSQNTLEKLLAAGSVNSNMNEPNKAEQSRNGSYDDFKKALKNSLTTKYKDLSRDELREIFLDIFDELGVNR